MISEYTTHFTGAFYKLLPWRNPILQFVDDVIGVSGINIDGCSTLTSSAALLFCFC